MGIFRNVSGLKGENIATEILSYLLSSKNNFIAFQKCFHQRIFGSSLSSSELEIEIVTQSGFPSGRPDMMACTNDSLILFENKLGSFLSGKDQLVKYTDLFNDEKSIDNIFKQIQFDKIKNKYLVLIAPRHIIKNAIKQSNEYLNDKFDKYCSDKNIIFKTISWEDILSDIDNIDNKDTLQYELYLFVNDYLNKELNAEEVMILKNMDVPSALEKLFKIISTIKNDLDIIEYKTERVGQSYNYFGFHIEHNYFLCWFGYILPIWHEYETPVFLQIKEEWIKDKQEDIMNLIKECKFSRNEEYEYILPFDVDDIPNWKNDLAKILEEFNKKLD